MNIIKLTSPEHDWFLEERRVDSISHDIFKVDDEVIVCALCKSVALLESRSLRGGSCATHGCQSTDTLTHLPRPIKSEILYFEADRDIVWDNTPIKIKWSINDAQAIRTKIEIVRTRDNRRLLLGREWSGLPLTGERELEVKEDMTIVLKTSHLDNRSATESSIPVRVCNHAPIIYFQSQNLILTESTPTTKLLWEIHYASKFGINNNLNIKETIGEIIVSPKKDTTYTLTATNISKKVASESISIKIDTTPIDIVSFQATPSTILAGDEVILSWEVPLKQRLTLYPLEQEVTNSRYIAVSPVKTTRYTLRAEGHFSNCEKELEIVVYPKVEITSFTSDNSAISIGSETTLRWVVKNYNKIVLIGGTDEIDVTLLTSYKIVPTQTTSYQLLIESKGWVKTQKSKNVEVEVFHPVKIQSFQADRISLVSSMPVVLTWQIQNATQVFITPINNQSKDVTRLPSIKDTPIKTTQYKLIAKNKLFQAEEIVLVQVMPLPSFNQGGSSFSGTIASNFALITTNTPIPIHFSSLDNVYSNHTKKPYIKIEQLFFDYTHLFSYFRDRQPLYYSSIKDTFVNLLTRIRSRFQN